MNLTILFLSVLWICVLFYSMSNTAIYFLNGTVSNSFCPIVRISIKQHCTESLWKHWPCWSQFAGQSLVIFIFQGSSSSLTPTEAHILLGYSLLYLTWLFKARTTYDSLGSLGTSHTFQCHTHLLKGLLSGVCIPENYLQDCWNHRAPVIIPLQCLMISIFGCKMKC